MLARIVGLCVLASCDTAPTPPVPSPDAQPKAPQEVSEPAAQSVVPPQEQPTPAPQADAATQPQAPLPPLPPDAKFERQGTGEEVFGEPAVKEAFEGDFVPLAGWKSETKALVGVLPKGFHLRAVHAGAEARGASTKLTGDNPEGAAAWRVDAEHLKGAYIDLVFDKPLDASRYTRVAVMLRSGTTMEISVGLFATGGEGGDGVWIQRRVGVKAEWQDFVFVAPPQRVPGNQVNLFFRIPAAGILDLDDLRVWSLDGKEFNAGLASPNANAFVNSSFPGGLPGGWSTSGTLEAGPDPATPGPSGLPSFKMTTDYRSNLISAPVRVPGNSRYQLSFWAKGIREGQNLEVSFGPPEKPTTQKITLTPDWKEYALTFRPDLPLSGFMNARFRTGNTLWIDQVRLAPGAPTGFARENPVELAAAPDEPYGIFEGDKLGIRVTLAGEVPDGARLVGSVENMQRRNEALAPVGLSAGQASQTVPIEIVPPAYAPYGTFRLQLRVEDAAGNPLSAWTETILHRVRPARHQNAFAADSPFGIHITPTSKQAAMAKKLGFNWMRAHDGATMTKWYDLEREPGKIDFTKADRMVEKVRAEKMLILGLLDSAPTFASHWVEAAKTGSYYSDALWVPKDIAAWRNYVEKTVGHFAGRIDDWEVWNEPYVGMFFHKEFLPAEKRKLPGTPDDYLPLLESAYAAAKTANPEARIFWATGPYYKPNQTWHERAAELGAGDHADALTFHVYTTRLLGFPDDLTSKKVADYRKGHRLADAPIWNTEGGPGSTFNHFYRHLPPFEAADQATGIADHVARFYISQLAAGVGKFFLYSFASWGSWKKEWTMMAQDGTLPPHASALSNLFWHLEDSKFAGYSKLADDQGWVARFDRADGQSVLVFLPAKPIVPQPGALDLYGNPLHPDGPLTAKTSYLTVPTTGADAALAGKIEP